MPIPIPILGVERDIERAIHDGFVALSQDQAVASIVPETLSFFTFSGVERAFDPSAVPEVSYPYISIQCSPAMFQGPPTSKYEAMAEIVIGTSAQDGQDASRQILSNLVSLVGWMLDHVDYSSYTEDISSLQLFRDGGDLTAYEHSAQVTINTRVLACGKKQ